MQSSLGWYRVTQLGLVLAIITVAACSVTPDVASRDNSQATPTASPRLTAAEFAEQGNAICSGLIDELRDILSFGPDASGPTLEQRQRADEARDARYRLLFELEVPVILESDLETLEAIRAERSAVNASRLPEPDIDERLGPPWRDATRRLGLDQCS